MYVVYVLNSEAVVLHFSEYSKTMLEALEGLVGYAPALVTSEILAITADVYPIVQPIDVLEVPDFEDSMDSDWWPDFVSNFVKAV